MGEGRKGLCMYGGSYLGLHEGRREQEPLLHENTKLQFLCAPLFSSSPTLSPQELKQVLI